jgi:long-chain fatty acid transport protein
LPSHRLEQLAFTEEKTVTRGHRVRFCRYALAFACVAFLVPLPAFPSGFQIMTQGARATGMGLAFTAIANDPSAIFYNPAGLGWQKHFEAQAGGSFLTKVKGEFDGANPYPGNGNHEIEHKTTFVLPNIYAVVPLTPELNFGLGINAPYGLGFRWDNAETFSGRFVAQNAVIQSTDINPVFSYQLIPELAIAVGADYRLSKVQLEKNQAAINPFTNSVVDVAHVKLNTQLQDNHGWGWNAGILYRPVPQFSIGAAYRSKIKVDYSGSATFQQRLTGNAQFDAVVAAQLPQGNQSVATKIEFPESVNLGAAFVLPADFTVALEADWTKWTRFNELLINFANPVIPDLDRHTNWSNSWAYRIGLEKKFSKLAVRAGYYRDKSPQPVADVGPILADNDRDAFTFGLGYDSDKWGVNLGDVYIKFKNRDTQGRTNNDNFFGVYRESANVFALDFRLSF